MAEQWTPRQRQAIEARGGTVLVNAGAGSGKTSVLVERIISLLTDREHPMPADRFLAVTFTNAAANGLAARLHEALQRRIDAQPDDRFIRRQNLLLRRAPICTVHAFCMQLLREHANELDIPLDFTVFDELSAAALHESVRARTLGELYADASSGLREFSALFGRSRSDAETPDMIEQLYKYECNLAFPERWRSRCLSELAEVPFPSSAAGRFLVSYALDALRSAKAICVAALALCDEDEVLVKAYAPAIEGDLDDVNRLSALCEKGVWDDLCAAFRTYSPHRLGSSTGAQTSVRDRANALRKAAKGIITDLSTKCFFADTAACDVDRLRTDKALRALFRATDVFSAHLYEEKCRRRCFEFSDLERLALRLLCGADGNPTPAAAEIAARYDQILVDEYQDTNEVQDLIFRLISRDEKNLFFVGDVKQSIYRFRRADPEIFLRRRASCYPPDAGLFPMRIDLAENFRSGRPVIEAVNGVFESVMSAQAGDTDYGPGEELLPYAGSSEQEPIGMELMFCESEPEAIAAHIRARLDEGYSIDDGGVLRPCRAGDFCILLRSVKGRVQPYAQALEARGIRVCADMSDNFNENSEIAVLLSLLRVIANPRRDVDLCAVLLSPLFGFTPDELLAIRADGQGASFCAALLRGQGDRVRAFLAVLKRLRAQAARLGVGELTELAVDTTNAEVLLCAGADCSRRQANIRMLIDYARSFESTTDASLESFIAVCAYAGEENRISKDGGFSQSADAVSILSVHSAKGLEWPIVIFANAAKPFNLRDNRIPPLQLDAALGAGFRIKTQLEDGGVYNRATPMYRALSLQGIARANSEEMRVLYVAFTRAKQQLIVAASPSDPGKTIEDLLPLADFERIDPFVVLTQSNALPWILLPLLQKYGADILSCTDAPWSAGPYRISCVRAPEAQPEAPEAPEAQPDAAALAALERRAAFRYGKQALTAIPAKRTVSELAKDAAGAPLYCPSYARGSLSGAERGSALHLFMQLADYRAAAANPQAELARLVAGEYIDAAAAATISLAKVRAYFDSPLGQLVLNAGTVLREYDFLDALPAREISPDAPEDAVVMIQGIADCIALEADGAVLIDYKSDRVQSADVLVGRYARQLALYARTLSRRLPVPIRRIALYSFHLGTAIDLPLGDTVGAV
ncbi:MAG: UvrD-helicase domain-containing protein [Oscillospiraceae bacterium]|nr:UvrD-helicase domain-containing protein [Oscillospiraceae bacterium]